MHAVSQWSHIRWLRVFEVSGRINCDERRRCMCLLGFTLSIFMTQVSCVFSHCGCTENTFNKVPDKYWVSVSTPSARHYSRVDALWSHVFSFFCFSSIVDPRGTKQKESTRQSQLSTAIAALSPMAPHTHTLEYCSISHGKPLVVCLLSVAVS